jgi:hypothetical protein
MGPGQAELRDARVTNASVDVRQQTDPKSAGYPGPPGADAAGVRSAAHRRRKARAPYPAPREPPAGEHRAELVAH